MKLILATSQLFNFASVVNSHGWRQLAPFRFENDVLFYADQLSTRRMVEYRMMATPEGIQIETGRLTKAEQKEVLKRVSWIFGLDLDFSGFYRASRLEPKLAHAEQRSLGRLLRSATLFEDVIKTILTTNTLWAATRNMTKKLVDEFGAPVGNSETKAFPTPEAIAASSPEYIKEKIRVGYRAPAIHDLAVRVAFGKYDLEALKTSSLSTLELRKELMTLKGVGPYAAANLLMLLGRHDFIPIDSSALTVVSHEWYRGKPVTAKHVEKRFEKWGEYKGLAFWFWDWKYNGG
jgi:3-methyladenine DNA glycosylase/8-oxoguanine DNA glycosylase